MLYYIGLMLGVMLNVVFMAGIVRLGVILWSLLSGRVRDRFKLGGYLLPAALLGTAISVLGVGEGSVTERLARPDLLLVVTGLLVEYAVASSLVYGVILVVRRGQDETKVRALDGVFRKSQRVRAPIPWRRIGRGSAELFLFVIVGGVAFEAILGGAAVLGVIAGSVAYFLYRRRPKSAPDHPSGDQTGDRERPQQ